MTWIWTTLIDVLTICSILPSNTSTSVGVDTIIAGSTIQTWIWTAFINIILTFISVIPSNTSTSTGIYTICTGSTILTWIWTTFIHTCLTIFSQTKLQTLSPLETVVWWEMKHPWKRDLFSKLENVEL